MALGERFLVLIQKYGYVPLAVYSTVSTASITGFYVAIKNNVDIDSIFEKVGLSSCDDPTFLTGAPPGPSEDSTISLEQKKKKTRNRTAELAASSGGALALAILCHKAMYPVRFPIMIVLTPPIARFLAKRNILKNRV